RADQRTQRMSFCPAFTRRVSSITASPIFFFNDPATTEIYTLSLHDALPIYRARKRCCACQRASERLGSGKYPPDRKSTRLNSSHTVISYAVFCLKKKKN